MKNWKLAGALLHDLINRHFVVTITQLSEIDPAEYEDQQFYDYYQNTLLVSEQIVNREVPEDICGWCGSDKIEAGQFIQESLLLIKTCECGRNWQEKFIYAGNNNKK